MTRKRLILGSAWPRATLAIVMLEAVCVLVLESLVLREHILRIQQSPAGNALSTPNVIYPILYILAIISLFALCIDAMFHRNQMQVVAFTFFNFLCFLYGIIQTMDDWQATDTRSPLKAINIAITVTMGVCTAYLAFAVYKLAAVFGWEMYRVLGADLGMRRMYKGYEILLTLLKFDVFFFMAYAIQMFTLVDTSDKMVLATFSDGRTLSRHQVLIGLAMPASAILLMLAFFGVMKENRIATIIVMVCLACAEPYFIYQLVHLHMPANRPRFINSLKYLTFFSSVTMVLVLITLFFMAYCFRNFDKGLLVSEKSRIVGQRRPFEIDEDPSDGVPSIPTEPPRVDDDSSQQLMAYVALKEIQEKHHIKPSDERIHHNKQHQGAGPSSNERVYNDKMEIDQ